MGKAGVSQVTSWHLLVGYEFHSRRRQICSSSLQYATAQTMPDGTVFVASGSLNGLDPSKPENNNPTYEILSPAGISQGRNIPMDILSKNQPYYMYPFVHLLKDGTLFIFVSKSAQIFNVQSNAIVKELPGTVQIQLPRSVTK